MLDDQERDQLLHRFNQTAGEYPEHLTVHQIFADRVKEHPHHVAVTFRNQSITYHELDLRVKQAAYALQAQGIGPDQIVALLTTRSVDMIVGILAILQAGGAYLPLDPSLPANRVAYMLEDSRVQVILTNTSVENQGNRVVIDMRSLEIGQGASHSLSLPPVNNNRNLAYCMYTSGTTGLPKGILVEHRSLMNFLSAMLDMLSFGKDEAFLSLTTVSFDIFWLESILPLLAGYRVVIADELQQKDVHALLTLVKQAEISVMQTTPSRLKLLLADSEQAKALSSLRYLLVGGEPLPQALVEQARRIMNSSRIFNLYGPTETTVWSTAQEVTAGPVNIGQPIRNTQVYILNDELLLQPIGVPGLLYIGGHGVVRGYQNNPELTNQRFIENPYRPGERIYCTGDIAKWTEEGTIEYLGRADFQVKIRGYRMELAEIEKQLDTHPAIEKSVVRARQDAQEEQILVAYYTTARAVSGGELREHLQKFLPVYMIPQHFMQLDKLPLMISGKLDVKALPPVTGTLVQPGEARKPQDEVETKLHEIWRKVMRIEDVGVQDGFFEMGGNSIQIMQLVYEINKCFPVSFQFTHFIERQTIERIAGFIKEAIQEEREQELPFIAADPANRHEPFPLTNVQMAYYLGRSSHFELGGVSTHSYLEIATELDIRRLNQCLNILIRRHPALHTVYLPDATQQILREVPEYPICEYDLSGYAEEAKDQRIAKERERMSHHIFNPQVWPLFEIVSFRSSPEESLLCVSFDLLIMDAYSLEILQNELLALYADRSSPLEELSITFRDYIVGYQQMKTTKWYLEDKEYWLHKVDDFPLAPSLPLLIQPQHVKNPYFKRKSKQYSQQHWRQLKQISQNHNLTPSAVLCTVYAEVLANWSNQLEFGLNLTLFNRLPLHSDVDKLIGDFTSLLLLEVRMNPEDSFWEKAGSIQQVLMEALGHRHFDGIDVMREISKRRELGNKALMPIVFTSALFENGENGGEAAEEQGGASDGKQDTGGITQTSQVYLDNQVALIHGTMVINWDYISELFDPALMDAMFEQYLARIEAILHSREEMGFPAVPASDYASIQAYNHTEEPIPSKTLHGLFEEAAHQTPYAAAIEADDASITYKELDERADQVAGCLRSLGVSAGDRVGVIARKEIATFINLLGILKSGAAYVPIDPEYPQERVDYIRNHSQCKLVLETDFYEKTRRGQQPVELQPNAHLPESLAYVIYTSGSTGNPKGVMISHQAACNTVLDINQKFQVDAADRILGISSLCFDLSVYDIFGAFAAGATLVLVKDQKDIGQLAAALSAGKITIWNSVPAIMDRVGAEIRAQGISQKNLDLRLVLLSGDWIPLHLPETVKQLFPAAKLISCGGATEASIWSIYYPIDEVLPQWTSVPYGKPLANQQFYVLNRQLGYCPLEVPGELYIGGRGVANGYLNDPGKTSHSFIHHSELGYIYRTGDYGVLHRDGWMEFLGRKDQQVKVGGYRIELGEVEAQLQRCEGVRHAVVLAADGEEKRLSAYLIPDSHSADQAAFVNEVRARIAKVLPDYMIPYSFAVLEQFPLTANGKIDVQALLKLQPCGNKQTSAYTAPRNEVEERIVNIFKALLEADQVGTLDNFFEMGINSVQIAMINNKLKQEFQKEIPLLTLFEYANIHALAEYLSGNDQNETDEMPQEQLSTRNQGRERMKQRSAKRRGHTDSE
ncbi:bacitracin synthetase 1 [Paenibacillus graminis]|uniref:Bacitracin synthetase 1 n=1 Tax=Paenibacillus graminis TaxID=189425 RepID=A0A089M7W2_9BACL|nr:bacitracin synthetase 1 [Paenibacillus graminis]